MNAGFFSTFLPAFLFLVHIRSLIHLGIDGEDAKAKVEVDGKKDERLNKDGIGIKDGVGVEVGLWGSWKIWRWDRYFIHFRWGFGV